MAGAGEDEDRAHEQKIFDALDDACKGTKWAPPGGGFLVDAVVIMLYMSPEGHYGLSWVSNGSVYQAEGMIRETARRIMGGPSVLMHMSNEDPDEQPE